jgi:hypothetical protein
MLTKYATEGILRVEGYRARVIIQTDRQKNGSRNALTSMPKPVVVSSTSYIRASNPITSDVNRFLMSLVPIVR